MEIRKLYINGRLFGSVGIADSFQLRLRGLLGRDFSRFDGLVIRPCADIHTMFMKYPIDALFVNNDGEIVRIAAQVKPWVPYIGAKYAKAVIELPAGRAEEWTLHTGDCVSIQ